jgi:hypothetical protein
MLARPTGSMFTAWWRFLSFRATRAEMATLTWQRFLGPALVITWLAGMGRYWDHPAPHLLQRLGLGSVVYVFALGGLLWTVMVPLRPRGWGYLQTVTFVSLTAPPALLYALPVERWMTLEAATSTNVWFLVVVAAWRVGLLAFTLRRHAALTWPRTLVGCTLPLCFVVSALFVLNLEKAVFAVMAGIQERTANDGAYAILFLLSLISFYAAVPLLIAYLVLARRARREALIASSEAA